MKGKGENLTGSGHGSRPVVAAMVAAVVLLAFGLAVGYGARPIDVLLWFLTEAVYVVLPGWLVFLTFSGRPDGALRQLTMGWTLGYVMGILAFMATAATGARPLMWFYPLLVVIPLGLVLLRRRQDNSPDSGDPLQVGEAIATAVVVGLGMTFFAMSFFSPTPLPGPDVTVSYFQDLPWTISLAADALHHWPMTDPSLSGEPLPYHNFSILHLASMSQVSGVELPVGFFRLWILPLIALTVLLMVESGRSLFGSARAGLIGALLLFFVGEFHLMVNAGSDFPFGWLAPTYMRDSPSFLFGIPFLLALVAVCGELFTERKGRPRGGDLLIIGLLAVGAAGSKVSILPLLLPAVGIFVLIRLKQTRRIDWRAVTVGLIFASVLLIFYLTLYRGHSSGLTLDIGAITTMLRWEGLFEFRQALDFLPAWLADPITIALEFFFLLGPILAGICLLLRDRSARSLPAVLWLGTILASAVLSLFLLTSSETGNYLYGVTYGLMIGLVLAAAGLDLGWKNRPRGWEDSPAVRWLGLSWLLCLGSLIGVQTATDVSNGTAGTVALLAAFLLLALIAALLLRRSRTGGIVLLLALAMVTAGFAGSQLTYRWDQVLNPPAYDPAEYRMTPGMYSGLRWLRDETPEDTVFAVNNQYALSWSGWPTAYDYAAFSERRAFYAAWGYSQRVRDSGLGPPFSESGLFPERKTLNDAAFAGDVEALSELQREHRVEYLVVDRVNGDPANLGRILRHGTIVYDDPDLVIVRLTD